MTSFLKVIKIVKDGGLIKKTSSYFPEGVNWKCEGVHCWGVGA
jgi:hypothetical protein